MVTAALLALRQELVCSCANTGVSRMLQNNASGAMAVWRKQGDAVATAQTVTIVRRHFFIQCRDAGVCSKCTFSCTALAHWGPGLKMERRETLQRLAEKISVYRLFDHREGRAGWQVHEGNKAPRTTLLQSKEQPFFLRAPCRLSKNPNPTN